MPTHYNYVKTRLIGMDKIVPKDINNNELIAKFCGEFLRRDGILIIRFTGISSSDIIASELLIGLWDIYLKELNIHGLDEDNNVQLENLNNTQDQTLPIRQKQIQFADAASAIDERAQFNAEKMKQRQDQHRRNSLKKKGRK